MLSINTNLSSLIAQSSMKTSTNKLNQAIERMTTGFKINHASDNAANYSIATNMTTKINSYMVAEDNVAMGLDLISTAEGTLTQIQDKLERLRALQEQASNGTYGEQSLNAINAEANALVDEINRLYRTAEYNGLKLFGGSAAGGADPVSAALTDESSPIQTFALTRTVTVDESKRVSNVTSFTVGETYYITTSEDLVALQNLVNSGVSTDNVTFELMNNIDMTGVEFNGIGCMKSTDDSYLEVNGFCGNFDGNGFEIKNLTVIHSDGDNGGTGFINVIGCGKMHEFTAVALESCSSDISIKNLGFVNSYISSDRDAAGVLFGLTSTDTFEGSLVIENCYSTGTVNAGYYTYSGGLIGCSDNVLIKNSYSNCDITGGLVAGGLIGCLLQFSVLENCYSTGNVVGATGSAGGLVGGASSSNFSNCYAIGNVASENIAGGLVGEALANVYNYCYSTGSVTGSGYCGGIVGTETVFAEINNCISTSDIYSTNLSAGGLIGLVEDTDDDGSDKCTISNSYSTGDITGTTGSGGIIGYIDYGGVSNRDSEILISNSAYKSSSGLLTIGSSNIENIEEPTASSMSSAEIRNMYSLESLGFTDANGWKIVDNALLLFYQDDSDSSMHNGSLFGIDDGNSGVETPSVPESGSGTGGGSGSGTIPDSPTINPPSFTPAPDTIVLQIGASSNCASQVGVNTKFALSGIDELRMIGLDFTTDYLTQIDDMLELVAEKQTHFGAVSNRLESVLEEITIQRDNLISSRSTIRDADIAEVSSHYIQQQILQQASATLLATANQSPSIALQLI